MDGRPADATTQDLLDRVRGAATLLGLVPGLLEERDALRAQAEAASRDAERARAELEPLRAEMLRYRVERDELTEALGRVMTEVGALINELGPHLRGGRPGAFAREPRPAAAAGVATSRR